MIEIVFILNGVTWILDWNFKQLIDQSTYSLSINLFFCYYRYYLLIFNKSSMLLASVTFLHFRNALNVYLLMLDVLLSILFICSLERLRLGLIILRRRENSIFYVMYFTWWFEILTSKAKTLYFVFACAI